MDVVDRNDYIERYRRRLTEHGYSPQTLGWGQHGRQDVRFSVLAGPAMMNPESSVLDVGCGFADLYEFLLAQGWRGTYTGVDIVDDLLKVGRERHPELDLRNVDITERATVLPPHDFVIASGVFNAALPKGDNRTHIVSALKAMHALAREAVCVDFMSTYVDFQKPGAWHTDPAWALAEARKLSRRVALRLDYMPFEFAMFIHTNDATSERNVFAGYEHRLHAGVQRNEGGTPA